MDINDLRRLVRQRHAAATNKVSRLRTVKGVEVGGSNADVRRDPSKIKRYNRTQLQSYLKQLNTFNSRSTTFEAGAEGARLPGAKVRELHREQRRYMLKGQERDNARGGFKLPGQDATVAQRAAFARPNMIRAGGEASNKPFSLVKLTPPSAIPGVEELQQLIDTYKKKNSREFLPEYLGKQREQAAQMMRELNLHDQIDDMANLSDDQFDTLFNDTSFAGDLGQKYATEQLAKRGNRNPAHNDIMNGMEQEISTQIEWARTLPRRIRRR